MGAPDWVGLGEPEDSPPDDSRIVPVRRQHDPDADHLTDRIVAHELADNSEHVIFNLRTHPKALIGEFVKIIVCLALIVAIFVFVPQDVLNGQLDWWLTGAVVLVALFWAGLPILSWWFTRYQVTTQRISFRKGILSRAGKSLPLSRITDIDYEQSLLDRMFGCGTLKISDPTRGNDGRGIELPDVPHVHQVMDALNDMVFARQDYRGFARRDYFDDNDHGGI